MALAVGDANHSWRSAQKYCQDWSIGRLVVEIRRGFSNYNGEYHPMLNDISRERLTFGVLIVLWAPAILYAQTVAQNPPEPEKSSAAVEKTPRPDQAVVDVEIPSDASEKFLIDEIVRLSDSGKPVSSPQGAAGKRAADRMKVVAHIDELLRRYPKTEFKEQALTIKLGVVAKLARVNPDYLRMLLQLTEQISKSDVGGELACESAFYSIQAFVLGARKEAMPEDRRLVGTFERYEAFLEDCRESKRAAVIQASLIRTALAMKRIERAERELAVMKKGFPDHQATRRASGEVYRATGVGKPFEFSYPITDGTTVCSQDYVGRVLVVHFWAFWHKASLEQLSEIARLNAVYEDQGLALISVTLDAECGWAAGAGKKSKMTWPICCEGKGFEGEVAVAHGVTALPSFFVIDRKGILRSTDPGDKLDSLVRQLLGE